MIEVKEYNKEFCEIWNDFVGHSRNGTFLHDRCYMDYHADRFCDASLMFLDSKENLVGVLPANVIDDVVFSHGGLTYGGLLVAEKCHYSEVSEMFAAAMTYYRAHGIKKFIYKPAPHIYHTIPSEEDIYWIFQNGGQLLQRTLSSALLLNMPLPFSELRRRKVRKALDCGLAVKHDEPSCYEDFWKILTDNLSARHSVLPVHNLNEISLLQQRFPDRISLSVVLDGDATVAGCVTYKTDVVAHIQYIASNRQGRETGALDLLFETIVGKYTSDGFRYLDFGISTENGGSVLNEGLLFQKEGFGGRAICYDTYEYKIPGTE